MSSGFTLQLRTNQCAVSCDRGVFWKSDKHQTHSLIIICIKRKHMSKIISICRTHNKFRTCSNFVLYVYVCVRFRAKFVRVLLNLHYILRCLVVVLNELNMWILYQKVVFFYQKCFFLQKRRNKAALMSLLAPHVRSEPNRYLSSDMCGLSETDCLPHNGRGDCFDRIKSLSNEDSLHLPASLHCPISIDMPTLKQCNSSQSLR